MLTAITAFGISLWLRRRRPLVAAIAVLAAGATSAHAQETSSLDALVSEALANNLGLRADRLARDRASAQVREARALFLPSISVDSRYTGESGTLNLGDVVNPVYSALNQIQGTNQFPTNVDVTLPQAWDGRLHITQPLFNETIRRNYRLARRRDDAETARVRGVARRLAAEVQTAAVSVADARSAVAIYQASLVLVAESERVATRLLEAGRATPDAVFRAKAERSDVEQKLAEAEAGVDAASRALNQLLGRPLDTPVQPLPDLGQAVDLAITEDQAVASALAHRDELAELDAGIAAADEGVGIATAAFLPTVAAAFDYGFQGQRIRLGPATDYWTASVVVSWNLFSGGRDWSRRQAAQADAQRMRAARADADDRIRLDVRQAYAAAVVARGAITTAEDRLAAARRSFELVRRRYEEGVASQIEFLDARTQLTNAELNRALTAHRYATRYFDLERAAALRPIN